ncbi:MAG: hypothetical protein ABL882_03295 [Sphingopyxis sp.]
MISWATDYWYLCLAALLIGIATAAWIWLHARVSAPSIDIDDDARSPAPARLEPAKPVIEAAKPVAFVAPVPEPTPVVAPSEERPAIAAAVGAADDLTLIKGVGPKLNALLISLGVTRFDQIAAWGVSEIGEVDRFLGSFKGRIGRDAWVEQAGLLSRGDHAAFAAKFGEVGSENR